MGLKMRGTGAGTGSTGRAATWDAGVPISDGGGWEGEAVAVAV